MQVKLARAMQTISPLRAGALAAILTLAFVSVIFNLQPRGWLSWYRLAVSGERTEAIITQTDPSVHRTCRFGYVVKSVRYEGSDQSCEFEVGQSVQITYLPADPSFATTANAVSYLIESILGAFAIAAVAGLGSAWSVRSRRSRLRAR